MPDAPQFPLIDRYVGLRLGASLGAEREPIEISGRLRPDPISGRVYPFWWVETADGRSAMAAAPGLGEVTRLLADVRGGPLAAAEAPVTAELLEMLPEGSELWPDLMLACNGDLLRPGQRAATVSLVDGAVRPTLGLHLPLGRFLDEQRAIAYGVVEDGVVVAAAWAHPTGVLPGGVADLAVATAPPHRHRGYAQAAVAAVVAHVAADGGEALYRCDPDHYVSQRVARRLGFVTYGAALVAVLPPGCRWQPGG